MPAASEPVSLPHTWRPLGVRMVGVILGLGLATVVVVAWLGFDDATLPRFSWLQRATVLGVALLLALLGYAMMRSRVVAEPDRLIVVNGYRRRVYDWAEVVAVNLAPGAPWVTLDLADGTTVSAMGIQGSDGSRARQAARELRATVVQQTAADG